MAEIRKLSVEKTLNKIRADDARQLKEAAFNDKIDVLDEGIGRMRAQRLRLERHQGKHQQERHATPSSPARYTFGKLVSRLFWFLRSKPEGLVSKHEPGLIAPAGLCAVSSSRTESDRPQWGALYELLLTTAV